MREGCVKGRGRGMGLLRDRNALELVDVALLLGLAHAHEEAEQGDGLGLVALGRAAGEVVEFGALAGGVEDRPCPSLFRLGDLGGNIHARQSR